MRTPRNKKKSHASKPTMASQADKHKLYEASVQCVESEIDFVDDTFKKLRRRRARRLREDFCGTANTSCEWVRRRATNTATAVDMDTEVQQWGRDHHIAELTPKQQQRIQLVQADVMKVKTEPMDVVLAMNFSYWIFQERAQMIRYFRRVYESLVADGIFFLDLFGGYEAFEELKEESEIENFTYVWHQAMYNPITGAAQCRIHFKFEDGSQLKNAFIYDWRLWTFPELTEILTEAGYRATAYWEGTTEDGEGDGVFTATTQGEADAGWVAYLVGEK